MAAVLVIPFTELPDWRGRELGVSDWLTIDQDLVDRFAELTGDRQWIHVDRERAKRDLGGAIAHGLLVLSMFPVMIRQIYRVEGLGRGLNYGHDRLRYVSPVPSGSRIRLRLAMKGCEPQGDGLRITWTVVIEREGSERPALVCDWIVLLYPAD
jgi:acyl dehydratase